MHGGIDGSMESGIRMGKCEASLGSKLSNIGERTELTSEPLCPVTNIREPTEPQM